jgi:UDP-N-acetylglucosamine 4,6-dehydratase
MRVLVTGGTGYFGQAMMRRLVDEGHQVCCLSRSEFKQAQLRPHFPSESKWMIGDVRDRLRVRRAMHGADLVIHAAALKRIEVGHQNPMEMVKTNTLGTSNVVEEAESAGIDCVVLSTDKAYAPVSPYGYSKAMAESVALSCGASVVRYGNVAGSTGSVIPHWRLLKEEHGKDSVAQCTDVECTRFWMFLNEAVDLVMNTARTMPSEIVIPKHLPAFRLYDLMEAMDIQFFEETGLPHWEKLHEGMCDGVTSDIARRMTVDELREALDRV